MSKTIVISNQKGGVGKTTTIINLASSLAELGKKILVVDVDPQGNAASGLNISLGENDLSTYDLLINDVPASDVIRQTSISNVSIIPANQELSGAQVELVNLENREKRLKAALLPLTEQFDYILIDTPPSLGLLTINAFCAADSVFIPIQCEYYALEGISQLLKTIKMIKSSINPDLYIEGVCLTMYDSRTNLSKEVMENVVAHFKEKTYKTIIPRNIKISEAPSHGLPINQYVPGSVGAKSYLDLATEFVAHNS